MKLAVMETTMDLSSGLTDGVKSYEIALLVMGVVLFAVLLGILVYMVVKNRDIKQILLFFLFPVVMIGFPAIQKISYDNLIIEVQRNTNAVRNDPQNTAAREDLSRQADKLEKRASGDPALLHKIAEANMVLGNTVKARQLNEQADRIRIEALPSREFRRKIER